MTATHPTRRDMLTSAAAMAAVPLLGGAARASGPAPSGFLKYFSFVSRKPDLSHDDFTKAWLAVQGPASRKLPHPFSGVVLSEVINDRPQAPVAGSPAALPIDGMIETWSKSAADHARTLASAAGKHWAVAGDALISQNTTYVTKEHLFIPPRQRDGTYNRLTLIVRKDGMTHEEYMDHWLKIHGPLATGVPGLIGFVLSEIIDTLAPVGTPILPDVDGIAESWYEVKPGGSPGQTSGTPEERTWVSDGNTFIQRNKSRGLTAEGHVYIPVPVA